MTVTLSPYDHFKTLQSELTEAQTNQKSVYLKIEGTKTERHVVVVKSFWGKCLATIAQLFGAKAYDFDEISAVLQEQARQVRQMPSHHDEVGDVANSLLQIMPVVKNKKTEEKIALLKDKITNSCTQTGSVQVSSLREKAHILRNTLGLNIEKILDAKASDEVNVELFYKKVQEEATAILQAVDSHEGLSQDSVTLLHAHVKSQLDAFIQSQEKEKHIESLLWACSLAKSVLGAPNAKKEVGNKEHAVCAATLIELRTFLLQVQNQHREKVGKENIEAMLTLIGCDLSNQSELISQAMLEEITTDSLLEKINEIFSKIEPLLSDTQLYQKWYPIFEKLVANSLENTLQAFRDTYKEGLKIDVTASNFVDLTTLSDTSMRCRHFCQQFRSLQDPSSVGYGKDSGSLGVRIIEDRIIEALLNKKEKVLEKPVTHSITSRCKQVIAHREIAKCVQEGQILLGAYNMRSHTPIEVIHCRRYVVLMELQELLKAAPVQDERVTALQQEIQGLLSKQNPMEISDTSFQKIYSESCAACQSFSQVWTREKRERNRLVMLPLKDLQKELELHHKQIEELQEKLTTESYSLAKLKKNIKHKVAGSLRQKVYETMKKESQEFANKQMPIDAMEPRFVEIGFLIQASSTHASDQSKRAEMLFQLRALLEMAEAHIQSVKPSKKEKAVLSEMRQMIDIVRQKLAGKEGFVDGQKVAGRQIFSKERMETVILEELKVLQNECFTVLSPLQSLAKLSKTAQWGHLSVLRREFNEQIDSLSAQ